MDSDKKTVVLDAEAEKLFDEIEGIVAHRQPGSVSSVLDLMAQSLANEQKQKDVGRILLCNIVFYLGRCFHYIRRKGPFKKSHEMFEKLVTALGELAESSNSEKGILIRFRGEASDASVSEKLDYEIIFEDTVVDLDLIPSIIKRQGAKMSRLRDRLSDAFSIFSFTGVSNIYLQLPSGDQAEVKTMELCIHILAGFEASYKSGSTITIGKGTTPIILDENNRPDPNLTMVAGINRLKRESMQGLVTKVDQWMKKKESSSTGSLYTHVFNAMFDIENLKNRLKKPPFEINNIKWHMIAGEFDETVTKEKAQVARIIVDSADGSPRQAARIVKSVYGNDYQKIDARNLEERLHLSSGLLSTIDRRGKDKAVKKEVLGNIQSRLDTVKDEVLDEVYIDDKDQKVSTGTGSVFKSVHQQVFRMISFFKGRSRTRKKMTSMVHSAILFDDEDYHTLATDFNISVDEAKNLVVILQNCFTEEGRFKKRAFTEAVTRFGGYEKKIFEFLWKHLKDVIVEKDRIPFLNALQILTTRMDQPKRAFKVLLEDFYQDCTSVGFSDSKALMLASLIVCRYDKSLADMEITPEDIVLEKKSLDKSVAGYAAWRLSRDQEKLYEKISLIHKSACEALEFGSAKKNLLPLKQVLALEREVFIFLSLIGTNVSETVLRSAVKEYGSPDSDLYSLKYSKSVLKTLMQNLRIAIRGLETTGSMESIPCLKEVRKQEEVFMRLKKTREHRDQARRITGWVDNAIKMIKYRS